VTEFFVPGRIEVLGKHTDYAGGRSLLCAVERGIVASAQPRSDRVIRVTDRVRNETRTVPLTIDAEARVGDWSNYVAVVARRVARNFGATRGVDVSFTNDLPVASGLSSSTALTIAVFLALDAVNELSQEPRYRDAIASKEALAAYLASVEMGGDFGALQGDAGVGTLGGSEDHTAILCGRADFLSQYAFIPTRKEREIPFPADRSFVIAFSGVAAEKTGNALASYNEASLATRKILKLWNDSTGRGDRSLATAIASAPDAEDSIREALASYEGADFSARRLAERFEQFVLESEEFVPRASEALARNDLPTFGSVVARSHDAAENMLRNQIPETMSLVRLARESGADAASAFGAGFGGSVWAMVRTGEVQTFSNEWRARYESEFPQHASRAEFFSTRPASAASTITQPRKPHFHANRADDANNAE
jgi:galactokinase